MSDYYLKEKLRLAEKKLRILEDIVSKNNQLFKNIGDRIGIHGEVVEALFLDAMGSDHNDLQKQIDDLMVMTKMIHPENAFKVTKELEARAKAAEEQAKIHLEHHKRRLMEEAEREALLKDLEKTNKDIEEDNLRTAQKMVDDVYALLKDDGISYDSLDYHQQLLADQLKHLNSHFTIERCGFLFYRIRWVGAPLKLDSIDHPIYQYLQNHRWQEFKAYQAVETEKSKNTILNWIGNMDFSEIESILVSYKVDFKTTKSTSGIDFSSSSDKLQDAIRYYTDTLKSSKTTLPSKPVIVQPSIDRSIQKMAEKIGVDPVDLECIMNELTEEDNEGIVHAFKQFVMMAKLSSQIAMQQAAEIRQTVAEDNRNRQKRWLEQCEFAKQQQAQRDADIKSAYDVADSIWQKVIDQLAVAIQKSNKFSEQPEDIKILISAIRDQGKRQVCKILKDRIHVNFDKLRSFDLNDFRSVLASAAVKETRHTQSYVIDHLRKNPDLILKMLEEKKLDYYTKNTLRRLYLEIKKRIVVIYSDGFIEDGGPWKKGEPQVIWLDHQQDDWRVNEWQRYGSSSY